MQQLKDLFIQVPAPNVLQNSKIIQSIRNIWKIFIVIKKYVDLVGIFSLQKKFWKTTWFQLTKVWNSLEKGPRKKENIIRTKKWFVIYVENRLLDPSIPIKWRYVALFVGCARPKGHELLCTIKKSIARPNRAVQGPLEVLFFCYPLPFRFGGKDDIITLYVRHQKIYV